MARKRETGVLSVRLSAKDLHRVDAKAAERGLTRSELIRRLLIRGGVIPDEERGTPT